MNISKPSGLTFLQHQSHRHLSQQQASQQASSLQPLSKQAHLSQTTELDNGIRLSTAQTGSSPLVFQPPQRYSQASISNPEQTSEQTLKFAQQLKTEDSNHRIKGLGNRFSELVEKGKTSPSTSNYNQELRQYDYYSHKQNTSEIDFSQFEVLSKHKNQSFTLELKTQSGASITFSIESFSGYGKNPDRLVYEFEDMTVHEVGQSASFRSTEINFDVQGSLTDKEREQLAEFGENLEAFSNKLFADGNPDLSALDLASFDSIASLSLNSLGGDAKPLSLEYQNSDEERFIEVNYDGNKAQIQVTKLGQMVFNEQGKEQVIQHYLDILSDSAKEAQSDEIQAQLMLGVFSAGFELSEQELNASIEKEAQRLEELAGIDASDGEKSKDALLPIPDFSFHFTSNKERPNASEKPAEYSGFNVELSLNTQQETLGAQLDTEQTQYFKLTGAYYEPVGQREQADFTNQTYRYTELSREVSNTVTTSVDNSQLLAATLKKESNRELTVNTYVDDELIDQENEEEALTTLQDLTEDLRLEAELSQQDILQQVLIDPFEE